STMPPPAEYVIRNWKGTPLKGPDVKVTRDRHPPSSDGAAGLGAAFFPPPHPAHTSRTATAAIRRMDAHDSGADSRHFLDSPGHFCRVSFWPWPLPSARPP